MRDPYDFDDDVDYIDDDIAALFLSEEDDEDDLLDIGLPDDAMCETLRGAILARLWDLKPHKLLSVAGDGGLNYKARLSELRTQGWAVSKAMFDARGKIWYILTSRVKGYGRRKKFRIDIEIEDAEEMYEGTISDRVKGVMEISFRSYYKGKWDPPGAPPPGVRP